MIPLDPSPDQAREWLRQELARPEYHRSNLLQRFLHWISEKLAAAHATSIGAGPWRTLASLAVFLLLVGLAAWLLTKVRRARASGDRTAAAVLSDATVSAAQWRQRAESALAAGDFGAALVDAFRSVCAEALSTGEVSAGPGATADELAALLAATRADDSATLLRAASWFDDVLYGDRSATRDQAEQVLSLTRAGARG